MILKDLKFVPHHSRYPSSSGHPFQPSYTYITKIELQKMKTTMSAVKSTLAEINKLDIIFKN